MAETPPHINDAEATPAIWLICGIAAVVVGIVVPLVVALWRRHRFRAEKAEGDTNEIEPVRSSYLNGLEAAEKAWRGGDLGDADALEHCSGAVREFVGVVTDTDAATGAETGCRSCGSGLSDPLRRGSECGWGGGCRLRSGAEGDRGMGLKYWYLGLAVTLAMVTVAVIRHVRAGRANLSPAGFPVAHTDRVKVLPRYRHLVRMQLRWLLVEAISLGLACLGVAIVVSRPAWVNIDSREMRNRDVMLCLDVSGSMSQTDAAVISSYQDLVGRLHGERIGFTVFDSAAATVFPLTDDYAFISDQLTETLKAMRTNQTTPVLEATRVGDRGASLIGDGLASCLQGFDRMGEARSRTVVLTPDNDLSGTPLFTLSA
ncbi:MAG: VWA domain-containing protein, partial [Acidipropionibacterium jensenii]|nr:VWA domain-containing protein [Acidipropionibacterium jensenii]